MRTLFFLLSLLSQQSRIGEDVYLFQIRDSFKGGNPPVATYSAGSGAVLYRGGEFNGKETKVPQRNRKRRSSIKEMFSEEEPVIQLPETLQVRSQPFFPFFSL